MGNERFSLPSDHSLDIQTSLNPSLNGHHAGEDSSTLTVRLLYLTTSKYDQSWRTPLHSHNFSEIFYITGGKGYFMVRGKKCPVQKGHLFIVNPQVEHGEFSSEENPLEYIVLGVEGMHFTPSSVQQDGLSLIHISQTAAPIVHCIETLQDEIQNPKPGQEVICQNLLNIIILMILRQKDIRVSVTPFNNVSQECLSSKEYIDSHFKDPITLDILAEQAHQNKYYIAHTFKEAFGISPIKYLMERRVEESKYLLEETDLTIGQISSAIGFSSTSHYSQAFRRSVGLSPNEYRKKYRK